MPLPLIPVISALAAGGTLVPHAAGGMIVTTATGYVTGTYLSTAAIGGLITAASTTLGAGALCLSSAAGSSGLGDTTVGKLPLITFCSGTSIILVKPVVHYHARFIFRLFIFLPKRNLFRY